MSSKPKYSCVIPAKNEAASLASLLPKLREQLPDGSEIIVVNDGSTDTTSAVCKENKVKEILHPYSRGNGAAVKAGARAARGEYLLFMDGDGQHKPEDIPALIAGKEQGSDMVVGARSDQSQASIFRLWANRLYNFLASFMVSQKVQDLTSGFRLVNAEKFKQFLYLLPNGFSYPTTITMAFFRAGYTVTYVPIEAEKRLGQSHISPIKDGFRFLVIIFKVGTLYSPLKIFVPIAVLQLLVGISYYLYTYFSAERLTNMTVIMIISAIFIFLIGLISEQITTLMYKDTDS